MEMCFAEKHAWTFLSFVESEETAEHSFGSHTAKVVISFEAK